MSSTGYHKDGFVYIRIPKNGSTTFRSLLIPHGWQEINLFDTEIDLTKCIVWGHITDPQKRHTKGLSTYLVKDNPDIDIYHPSVEKILVSGVFDSHTHSISMILGHLYDKLNIQWIPLDARIFDHNTGRTLDGNDLTNHFFQQHDLDLRVTEVLHSRSKQEKEVRDHIDRLKIKYHDHYQQVVKHIIEPDMMLYNRVVMEWEKKFC